MNELNPSKSVVERYIYAATAGNTRLAYQSHVRSYEATGGPLPATPSDLTLWAIEKVKTCKMSTIEAQMFGIKKWHLLNGLPDPTDSIELKTIIKGMRRTHGTKKRKAKALTLDQILQVCELWTDTIVNVRDAAVVSIGFFGALRRSELASLMISNLEWTPEGLLLTLPRSKTDQTGEGYIKGIPYRNETCPLAPLRRWLELSGIKSGPLFRPISRHGPMGDGLLGDKSINRIVKKAACALGLDPSGYSGHSLRRGLATAASHAGASREDIKRQGNWKSEKVLDGYIQEGNVFTSNVINTIIRN